jgi:hypothetical protein
VKLNATHARVAGALAAAGCMAAVASPASAQSPTVNAYSGAGPSVQTKVGAQAHNRLPFTGLDLGLLAGAGVAIASGGVALRWVTRAKPHS